MHPVVLEPLGHTAPTQPSSFQTLLLGPSYHPSIVWLYFRQFQSFPSILKRLSKFVTASQSFAVLQLRLAGTLAASRTFKSRGTRVKSSSRLHNRTCWDLHVSSFLSSASAALHSHQHARKPKSYLFTWILRSSFKLPRHRQLYLTRQPRQLFDSIWTFWSNSRSSSHTTRYPAHKDVTPPFLFVSAPRLFTWPPDLACVQPRALCTLNHACRALPVSLSARPYVFLIRLGT